MLEPFPRSAPHALQAREAFVASVWEELADVQGFIGANRDVFPEEHFNEVLFGWAFGVLRARTFAPLQADAIALVPLIDLATHDAAADGWHFAFLAAQ